MRECTAPVNAPINDALSSSWCGETASYLLAVTFLGTTYGMARCRPCLLASLYDKRAVLDTKTTVAVSLTGVRALTPGEIA